MAATAPRTLLWTLLGGILGTALGEILSRLLPANALTRFFTAGVPLGATHPLTLDIRVLEVTFGALVRINLLGILGAVIVLVAHFRHA
jgi:Domain of unknown function (DUF4321)